MDPNDPLHKVVNAFFGPQPTVTRKQCDDLAVALVGGIVIPTSIQGAFSYTVMAGPNLTRIVQFRVHDSVLNMMAVSLAQMIHPQLVPACTYHGKLGGSSPFLVYVMEKLCGFSWFRVRSLWNLPTGPPPMNLVSRRRNTAVDLARYFAASWNCRPAVLSNAVEATYHDLMQKLELLSQALPSRFMDSLRRVRAELPLLFAPTYPLVLSHGDLSEFNIYVDVNTGHLTGIIDWAEACILPFGISLWSLENILGHMDARGWHYYDNHHMLGDLFWQTFEEAVGGVSEADRQAIRVARMVGFFLRYGFVRENGVRLLPAKESDSRLRYLDTFCMTI
ncbi:uncharacterized protein PV06_08295 [Exophiala oligosperma]|uniref:Aminoglycoside phosphotransferase domain-containing protein n=1 Tax=Exophiala oligosperma TaxID=215243 RepID=A0A0D2AHT2_9EURO|nr:uncharacterized protein PV06_08295 [Exophiala oligosperma]KIW39706.1 hypothetical protein PV06_08295 [Exophiala oligosperma]